MVFSSLDFIFHFLPIFLIVYYLVPARFRNIILLFGSIYFYSIGDLRYLFLLLMSVIVNTITAKSIRHLAHPSRKKAWLIAALVYNFGILFFFKYINFTIDNLNAVLGIFTTAALPPLTMGLPLGISFYTFQAVSYIVDIYRGDIEEEPSLFHFATYLLLFPKLVSGPITPYQDIRAQLNNHRIISYKVEEGLKIFILGLAMKVLLADRIGILWNDIQTIGFISISTPLAWLGAIGFALELYFDFHGYTLMAIGVGKMLGFELPLNFNHPYLSKSMTEFWRRWHITLGKWFRDYVYIPLGGNRKGTKRLILNLLVVWLFTGLWHGASWNYILWGLSTFLLIVLEKLWLKPYLDRSRLFSRLYMLLVIPITWMIFAINDLKELAVYLGRMFSVVPGLNVNTADFMKYLLQYKWLFLFGIFFCFPYGQRCFDKYKHSIFVSILLFFVFWYCIYQLANGINNPFMYFQF